MPEGNIIRIIRVKYKWKVSKVCVDQVLSKQLFSLRCQTDLKYTMHHLAQEHTFTVDGIRKYVTCVDRKIAFCF